MASTLLSRRLLSSSSSSSKTGLDKTLSIAFAIVLFTGFFYLVIFSIQQCILRRRRQQVQSQHQTTEQANPERSAELHAIPVIIYGSSSGPPGGSGDVTREVDISCSVCLAEYEEGEEMKVLPRCGHMFHRECIDRWLIALSSVCPICRNRAIEHVVGPGETRCSSREVARSNNVGFGLSHGII